MLDQKLAAWRPHVLGLLRIVTALLFLEHGVVKLLGWPVPGPEHLVPFSLIWCAAMLEVGGGVLLTIGLFSRVVAFILSGEMAVAYFMGHFPHGFWPMANRGEAAILFCFVFLYIAVAGGGRCSLDALRGKPA